MRFDLMESAATETRDGVLAILRQYNRASNSAFFARRDAPEHAPRPLHVIIYDDQGAIAGGLIGESQFSWLKVQLVAVREDLRRQGAGSRLMHLAEEEGLRRGCRYVCLDTMSYQAPAFYQKLGYRTAGELPDWDSHGHTQYFFIKTLE